MNCSAIKKRCFYHISELNLEHPSAYVTELKTTYILYISAFSISAFLPEKEAMNILIQWNIGERFHSGEQNHLIVQPYGENTWH